MRHRMRHRPSTERKIEDSRWARDKRGNWRYTTESISEVAFCQRATRERNGWFRAAKINAAKINAASL